MDLSLIALAVMTLINGYWTWKSRQFQYNGETIKAMQKQLEMKDQTLKEMVEKKNVVKHQYETQLVLTKRLQGQLETYHNFHGHEPLA